MFGFFKKRNDESAIIRNVYRKMNQEHVRELFYGDETSASAILLPLWRILYPSSAQMNQTEADAAAFFYTQVWIRKHGSLIPVGSNTNYIKDMLEKRFPEYSPKLISDGVDRCVSFIYEKEPALEEKDEEFIKESGFTNQGQDGKPILVRTPNSQAIPEGYQSIDNLAAQDPYLGLYLTAEMLFEENRLPEAISVFEKCIAMKPEETRAWFEKAEAQIKLKDYKSAAQTLRKTAEIVKTKEDKARLYRRMGFILVEERYYDDAIACLQYSLRFEQSERATGELQYIDAFTGKKGLPGNEDAGEYLRRKEMLFVEE